MQEVKELTQDEKITGVRQFVDAHFSGLFRDVYNIIEIAFDDNEKIGKKIKELVGKRIAITNEETLKAIDSLYSEGLSKSLPPVSSRYHSQEDQE